MNAMVTIHGIASCDGCRAARRWLESRGVDHRWHDIRADGLDAARIERWQDQVGWDGLLNRRSITWRRIPDADRQGLDAASVRALILAHPTVMRRPVAEHPGGVLVGFDAEAWAAALDAGCDPR